MWFWGNMIASSKSLTDEMLINHGLDNKPQFPRSYKVQLTPDVHMVIETRDYGIGRGRSLSGKLMQNSGSAVWFEPESPADRILDRDLLPYVEGWCERILRIDREFARNLPDEFVDKSGQKWRRA